MFDASGAVGGATGIAGSIIGANASNEATNKAMEAEQFYGNKANEMLGQTYADQKAYIQPWDNAGLSALSGMQDPYFQQSFQASDFQKDPGYDFRLSQGQQALERSAAARGAVQSGATLKALSRYNQDFASNEYNNAYNRFNNDRNLRFGRLSSIAGLGENAMGMGVNAAGNYGARYSDNMMNMGREMANGQYQLGQNKLNEISGISSGIGSLASAAQGAFV